MADAHADRDPEPYHISGDNGENSDLSGFENSHFAEALQARKIVVDLRGQSKMARLVQADRKAKVTHFAMVSRRASQSSQHTEPP